jgi:glutamine amidotransferase-like uncharacterized protein
MRPKYLPKFFTILITIIFFTTTIEHGFAINKSDNELLSNGIIVPLIKDENVSFQNQINSRIRHMINDILREKIPVYWTRNDISINVSKINDIENIYEVYLEKGTFIIPFTGEDNKDAKILSIVCDYNQISEIENEISVPIYLYFNKLVNLPVIVLSEVKIAQYHSKVTAGEMCFLEVAKNCGFLTFEFMTCKTLQYRLNNSAFTVLSWAGGDMDYASFRKSTMGTSIRDDIRYKVSKTVRKFVSEGGGYMGSCHGAFRATYGMEVGKIPITMKRAVYNPNLPTILVFALAETLTRDYQENLGWVKVKIVNNSHPVIFNVDSVTYDNHIGGSKFITIGNNVEIIANFTNTNSVFDNSPCWVSATFGKGRAVLFSSHPEIAAWQNENHSHNSLSVVGNSYFYTSSKGFEKISSEYSRSLLFITNIWEKTIIDLSEITPQSEIFKLQKDAINLTNDKISQLCNRVKKIQINIEGIMDKKGIDFPGNETFLGHKSTWLKNSMLEYYKKYLKDSIFFMTKITKIYPLIKNNPNFQQELNDLKNIINLEINSTKEILKKCEEICDSYLNSLDSYNKIWILSSIREIFIRAIGHQLYTQVFCGFNHVPKIYFDTLKFLRHQWYDYETTIALIVNN